MDPQILLFQRQYLQLFEPDFLAWPPKQLLRDSGVQEWLYNHMFNAEHSTYLPSERYQFRVIKPLVSKIEQSIEDPEEDEISDQLVSHLSSLIATELPSEETAVQQRSYVTFTCLPSSLATSDLPDKEPTITLLERRNLISGSKTTGFRTWEAALHLGSYLLSPEGAGVVHGKNVFELGVGTGLLSILCVKHLGARHVTATDGDEQVVEAFKENLFLNGFDDESKVNASVLRWGQGLKGTWVEDECETCPYDLVLGADITYDTRSVSPLVATLRFLFDLRPGAQVLIATAVRNAETFETLRHACDPSNFHVQEIEFEAEPVRQQKALFYAAVVPFKILSITKS
ncbi:hypothetical protein LTR37_005017 [Vermiconidia calcicola]|uniref:Uncharacterized protein n=1 Tax=Vermiconidia calcicola TaxID=1690605 RepID=A0ACC3NKJ5_9PEZI|nr:hypothetical protein LTR37_005017 [Vermiconidia calcicola]